MDLIFYFFFKKSKAIKVIALFLHRKVFGLALLLHHLFGLWPRAAHTLSRHALPILIYYSNAGTMSAYQAAASQ